MVKKPDKLKKKHDTDESSQRPFVNCKKAASSTCSTDFISVLSAIDAQERRDVATLNTPNAFAQTMVSPSSNETRLVMKITEDEVNMMSQVDSIYEKYVV